MAINLDVDEFEESPPNYLSLSPRFNLESWRLAAPRGLAGNPVSALPSITGREQRQGRQENQ